MKFKWQEVYPFVTYSLDLIVFKEYNHPSNLLQKVDKIEEV